MGAAAAQATVIAAWTLDEVVAHADLIVTGTVGASRGVRDAGRVLTETEIAVDQVLLGTWATPLVISQPGGKDGDIVVDVAGTVRLTPGDRVLLITALAKDRRRYIVGLSLGFYRLDGDRLSQQIEVQSAGPGGALRPAVGPRTLGLDAVNDAIARRRR